MPTRKINPTESVQPVPCFDADHNPPSMMVYEPGTYEHTCSGCKRVIIFTVNGFSYVRSTDRIIKEIIKSDKFDWLNERMES
jgi:hypothetical protein